MYRNPPKRMTFVADRLVDQIIEGRKTASVCPLGEVDLKEGDYDDALVVGDYYDVYDSERRPRCTIRIIGMELCRWDNIPERLYRGETNSTADEFREDHREFFGEVSDDFEFVAYYFELAS
ncbi:MAG TPA: ASCH domain-containing protein [candidate division Zixibacteria bacterium]|nr:ASCH domain-containing protein [candidate division Zixibacteria bacterium]